MTPEELCTAALSAYQQYGKTLPVLCARLPSGLREATTSLALCARAIDEVEDDPTIPVERRSALLRQIAGRFIEDEPRVGDLLDDPGFADIARRLDDWIAIAPAEIRPSIMARLSAGADRMAFWVDRGWNIETEGELGQYAYAVSGSLMQLFADLCTWHHGMERPDQASLRRYGAGISIGNMVLGLEQDRRDGKDYVPAGWTERQLVDRARSDLVFGTDFALTLGSRHAREFLGAYSAWYLVRVEEFGNVGRYGTLDSSDFERVVRAVTDGVPARVGRSSVEVPTGAQRH